MRIDKQISPASSSSSSSGLLADIDMTTKRPRRESELEVAVQKLKDMSTTETKGDNDQVEHFLSAPAKDGEFLQGGFGFFLQRSRQNLDSSDFFFKGCRQ